MTHTTASQNLEQPRSSKMSFLEDGCDRTEKFHCDMQRMNMVMNLSNLTSSDAAYLQVGNLPKIRP